MGIFWYEEITDGRQDFLEAMHSCMMADSWIDASYIAEYVLSINELKGYYETF